MPTIRKVLCAIACTASLLFAGCDEPNDAGCDGAECDVLANEDVGGDGKFDDPNADPRQCAVGDDTCLDPMELCETGECAALAAQVDVCTAIRGNGQLIFAHFASLARIAERSGTIRAAAGGSSASITMFLLESMQMHPALEACDQFGCDGEPTGARLSLMLKSLQGYVEVLSTTDEAAALTFLAPVIGKAKEQGLEGLVETDVQAAHDAFLDLLNSPELKALINPEIFALLSNSPNELFHAEDLIRSLLGFGDFKADDPMIFVRPGVLDFTSMAAKLGRIGSFYAGYEPADVEGMRTYLDQCAERSVGLDWIDISKLETPTGNCADDFRALVAGYRANLLGNEAGFPSRIDDAVGEKMPVLVSTSVLTNDAVAAFAKSKANYDNAAPEWNDVSFDDVKFGYWGKDEDLNAIAVNKMGYTDAKTEKFLSLGGTTWRTALSYSPAEPGLARALEIDAQNVSAGGWSDLHPSLVLRNMGCDHVVYVTREGQESGFATGVATLFGMDETANRALYDLENPESAYALSITESDAVWCTDWNNQTGTDLAGIFEDAYNAPVSASNPELDLLLRRDGQTPASGTPGCN